MKILGVDPGLRRTGFGVIQVSGSKISYIASGTIVVPTDLPLAQRLFTILDNLQQVANDTKPDLATIEKVFVNTNPKSTLLLGQARGAALCALAASGLDVFEYTALQIKKAVVGTGRADKEQMQAMVQRLLVLSGKPATDAADALACAICHAHHAPLTAHLKKLSGQSELSGSSKIKAGRFIA